VPDGKLPGITLHETPDSSISAEQASSFPRGFGRWARRVRARLLGRSTLTGACFGLALAAVGATLCWWLRAAWLLPWTALLGVLGGATAGAIVALRRRWSDAELALYLDARLGTHELISSALGCQQQHTSGTAARDVLDRAAGLLERAHPRSARPPLWQRRHWLGPVGACAVVVLCVIPLPAAPNRPTPAPGVELLRTNDVAGLDRIIELDRLEGRDPEQTKRLKRIAEEARRLREQLQTGVERRQAQAKLAQLRDEIAAEQLSFGNERNRAGVEAAVRELQRRAGLDRAAKALGDGDLVELDRQMQELARQVEREHRVQAKQALEDAKRRAKAEGARELEAALDAQRQLFERREAGAEALRELAFALGEQLSDEARRDLEEFGSSGDPEALRRFGRALEDALERLTPEQRKRLAERLKGRAQADSVEPLTEQQLRALAERLDSPEGRKQLIEQLERLAEERSADAERERSLDEAERGGRQAERGLGLPLPMAGGPGSNAPGPPSAGGSVPPSGTPGQGKSEGGGPGQHAGKTPALPQGKGLVAKAEATLNPGVPLHGAALGRAPARVGETARLAGRGAIGTAAPAELGAVERSEVPEEYREQVGRYFQP
jgi:hypothetical protein